MNKPKIQEIEFIEIEVVINNKIYDFVNKYNEYPKYLKLPLWVSRCIKGEFEHIMLCKIDYDIGLLRYRDLIVCETISISELEEIEVF